MMKLLFLVLLGIISAGSASFPVRTNVFLIVDTYRTDKPSIILEFLTELLRGISLMRHRISMYTTNGVSQRIVDYEARQCLLDKIRKKKSRKAYKTIGNVLNNVSKEILNHFYMEDNILVIITDIPISTAAKDKISWLKMNVKVTPHVIRLNPTSNSNTQLFSSYPEIINTSELLKQLPFYEENLSSCSSTREKPVYDECLRQCSCINGRLTNCYRVRRHFSSLTLSDRLYIIKAYKTLCTDNRYNKAFLRVMYIHPKAIAYSLEAALNEFFPFHRRYELIAENLYRLIDCRLTIPYWNFPLNSEHLWSTTPSYHFWDDIGGLGNPHTRIENGFCVETGDFRYPKWKLPDYVVNKVNATNSIIKICKNRWHEHNRTRRNECLTKLNQTFNRHCVCRAITAAKKIKLPTLKYVSEVLKNHSADDLRGFTYYSSFYIHGPIHQNLGGWFGTFWGSFNPEFFFFHSMLDGLWDLWQQKGPEYKTPWKNDTKYRLRYIKDYRYLYLDNDNLGGCGIKVKYTNDIIPQKKPKND